MIAILLPVHPNWMAMILNGDKRTEVRRNAPRDWVAYLMGKGPKPKPKTVFLYCTKGRPLVFGSPLPGWVEEKYCQTFNWNKEEADKCFESGNLCGKVVGKFTLEEVERIETIVTQEGIFGGYEEQIGTDTLDGDEILKESCLSREEFSDYLDIRTKKKIYGYAWHISNLEIFEEPREISSLKKASLPNPKKIRFANWTAHYYWVLGDYTTKHGQMTCGEIVKAVDDLISVKRAPQSWCYVSDGKLDKVWL